MNQKSQEFDKYKEKGAYHWRELRKNLKRYNAGLAARYNISEDIIVNNCAPKTIIDIGCGDGYFAFRLAKLYKNSTVIGLDTDEIAIRLAKQQTTNNKQQTTNLSFIHGDIFECQTKADLIVATDVIEHLYLPNEFIAKCFSILEQDGFLFLSTPIRYKEVPDDKYHIHEFFYKELESFIYPFGFSIVEHKVSHDYSDIERYNKRVRLFGISRMRLYKYIYNLLSWFGKNVFEKTECKLPTVQYLLLKKTNEPA